MVATVIVPPVLVTIILIPLTVPASHTVVLPSGLGFIVADEAIMAEAIMADPEVVTGVVMDTAVIVVMGIMAIAVIGGTVVMAVMVVVANSNRRSHVLAT